MPTNVPEANRLKICQFVKVNEGAEGVYADRVDVFTETGVDATRCSSDWK